MDKVEIYTQIISLKETKKGTIKDSSALELIKATGYVNIIDILLLPLYYTWEHSKYGTLEEVGFEAYLVRAYTRYSLSTKKYRIQIILVLRKTSARKDLSIETRSIVKTLLRIYAIIR